MRIFAVPTRKRNGVRRPPAPRMTGLPAAAPAARRAEIHQVLHGPRLQAKSGAGPAVGAPQGRFRFRALRDGQTYKDPTDPKNPVRVTRRKSSIVITFVGSLAGRDPITFPQDKNASVYKIRFGGKVNFLAASAYENRIVLGRKSWHLVVERTGVITEKTTGKTKEKRRSYPRGLRVHVTPNAVVYSLAKGKVRLEYVRPSGVLRIVAAANPRTVLFDSGRSFKKLRDLQIEPHGKGKAILERRRGGVVQIGFDLSASFRKSFIHLGRKEIERHDALVRILSKSFKIRIVEEGRQLSSTALRKVLGLLSGLSWKARKKIRKAKPTLRISLAQSQSVTLGLESKVAGETPSGFEEVTTVHELVHNLFTVAGMSTENLSASGLKGRSRLKSQVKSAQARRGFKSMTAALQALSTDTVLNSLWLKMFVPLDPEGKKIPGFHRPPNARVIDLCQEGYYLAPRPHADIGHPSSNVDEFVASFVTLATVKRAQFVTAVKAARVKGKKVSSLFKRTWSRIRKRQIAALGRNPF